MTTVTVRAGTGGSMEEVVFGPSAGDAKAHDDAHGAPSPYDYLLMALGA